MDQRQCFLRSPLFVDISERDLELLIKTSHRATLAKGEAAFMQGDPATSVFILSEGIIKISRVNTDGRKLTIDLIESGHLFGELCLTGEKERRSFAEAMVDSVYCVLDKNSLETFMHKKPDFALKLIQHIGNRRLVIENLLENMAFMDVAARVMALLMKYAVKSIVKVPFTHQEIADLTGSTRVSVSRCITKLRKDGVIETAGERIRVVKNVAPINHRQYTASFTW